MAHQLQKTTRHTSWGHQMLTCFHLVPPQPHTAVPRSAWVSWCTPCTPPMPHTSPTGEMPKCRAPAFITRLPPLFKNFYSAQPPLRIFHWWLLNLDLDFNPLLIWMLIQKQEDSRGFWRCLVFSINGLCFKDFSEHPAGAGGSKGGWSALVHFISSQASSGFISENLASHQPDLDQFMSPLKTTLPPVTLVTLFLATVTFLPLIPACASCT